MDAIKNKKGFTLVEIIISIAVFCIACALVLNVFVKSEKLNDGTEKVEKLSLMAANAIEAAKAAAGPDDIDCPGTVESRSGGGWSRTAYFDGEWKETNSQSSPVYYLKLILTPSEKTIETESDFKSDGEQSARKCVSALYTIRSEAGYMEESPDSAVSYETSVHYVFGMEGGR